MILTEFEKNTEATLYFDDFNLSLIRNFPDFTLSLDKMGIIGKGVFSSDTLFKVGELSATVDINEVMFGDDLSIKSIAADGADITILVLADGTANYDIAKASDEIEEEVPEESESVSLGLKSISKTNSEFVFYDQGLAYFMQLAGINVTGEGDFASDIFDLDTKGKIDDAEVTYEGVDYLHNKAIDLDVLLSMDLTNSVYTFKENIIHVNDFPLAADGSFALLEDGFGMDLPSPPQGPNSDSCFLWCRLSIRSLLKNIPPYSWIMSKVRPHIDFGTGYIIVSQLPFDQALKIRSSLPYFSYVSIETESGSFTDALEYSQYEYWFDFHKEIVETDFGI